MTKAEALGAIYQIRQALVLANKLCPNSEIKDALTLTIKLFFYITAQVGTEAQSTKGTKQEKTTGSSLFDITSCHLPPMKGRQRQRIRREKQDWHQRMKRAVFLRRQIVKSTSWMRPRRPKETRANKTRSTVYDMLDEDSFEKARDAIPAKYQVPDKENDR